MARLASLLGATWTRAQALSAKPARIDWRRGMPADAGLRLVWRAAERGGRAQRCTWAAPTARAAGAQLPWGRAAGRAQAGRLSWAPLAYLAGAMRLPWGLAAPTAGARRVLWVPPTYLAGAMRLPWGLAAPTAGAGRVPWPAAFGLTRATRLPWGRFWNPLGAPAPIVWDHEPDTPDVPGHVVPLRLVYRMLHSVTIRPSGSAVDIDCASITITQDADSWAYSVDVEILGRTEWQRVAPADGEPVDVVITVDGYEFRALIESCEGTHQHARMPVGRARGRALSAWLASEYSPARDYAEAGAWNLSQLADRELPPSGWTLDWQAADGAVPAGAWAYQALAPIAAIARCADAAGAIIVPSRAAQTLTVTPRWPVLPWLFADAVPDIEAPIAALLSATEALPAPGYPENAVYVVGGDIGGVLGRVLRAGTAGDRLAASVQDALITAEPIARARGARALADLWPAPAYTSVTAPLSTPGGDWPLLGIGQLVSLTGSGAPVRGIVSSVTVTARTSDRGGIVVEQQIDIGPRSRNAYTAWRRLQDARPLLPATVIADLGGGRYTVALAIGGAEIPVRSSATTWAIGATVWVQAGSIVGAAPAFAAALEIEI